MAMSNTWGAGGLFEAAVQNSMAATNAKTETDRMQAKTQSRMVDNNYDIGLRGNAVQHLTAGTQQYGAESQRLDVMGGLAKGTQLTPEMLRGGGLRSFRPIMNSSMPLLTDPSKIVRGTNNGVASFGDPPPTNTPSPDDLAAGFAKGGVVGDVAQDKGADTVDAKVRPGEFMLNPETVAHIGGGDYESGLRQLNQLVRQATGKEPGPTPVGKSGKPGFADSGALPLSASRALVPIEGTGRTGYVPNWSIPEPVNTAAASRALVPIEGTGRTGYVPNWSIPEPVNTAAANEEVVKRAAQARMQNPTAMPPAEAPVDMSRGARWAAGAKEAGKTTGEVVRKALPMLKSGALEAAAPAAATVEAGYNMYNKGDFYNDESVPAAEKFKQSLRDMKNPAAAWAGGLLAAGAAAPFTAGLGSFTAGAAGALGAHKLASTAIDDEGETFKEYRKAHPIAKTAAEAKTAGGAEARAWENQATSPPEAPTGAKTAEKAKAADPEFSMRDYLLQQIKENDESTSLFGSKHRAQSRDKLIEQLGQNEGKMLERKGMMAQLAQQQSKTMDAHIGKTFTKPELDKDGKPTGKDIPDGAKTEAFRKEMADNGIDIYRTDPKTIDGLAREWGVSRGLRDNINKSMNARGGDHVALSERDFMPTLRTGGVGIGSAYKNKGVTAGDVMSSWNPAGHEMTNNTLVLPDGEEVAASEVLKRNDGSYDQEMIDHVKAGEQGLRKYQDMIAQARKSQKKD